MVPGRYSASCNRSGGSRPRWHSPNPIPDRICGRIGIAETASYRLSDFGLAPGYGLGRHEHLWPGIAIVLNGCFDLAAAHEQLRLVPGRVLTLPEGVEHEERSIEGARCLLIQVAEQPPLEGLDQVADQLAIVDCQPAVGLGNLLVRELWFGEPTSLPIDVAATELFVEVHGLLESPRYVDARPGWARRVAEILHDSWRDPPSLTELSALIGVSPPHLARSFRRATGCTVGDFIRRRRLLDATHRLRATSSSLATVAHDSGFADQSHMSRQFRHYFGITPRQYRLRW